MGLATVQVTQKLCSGSSVLPPKDIFAQSFSSPTFCSMVTVSLQTWMKPFAGIDVPLQRAMHVLNVLYGSCCLFSFT